MTDLQSQVNSRVNAFVAEITELARKAAYEMLASALDQEQPAGGRGRRAAARSGSAQSRRKGAKRTPEELNAMADAFLAYIKETPGQRMENIAKALGYSTQELTLPVKKLLGSSQIKVEGQKRATSYYPASEGEESAPKSKPRSKSKTRRRRRKKA